MNPNYPASFQQSQPLTLPNIRLYSNPTQHSPHQSIPHPGTAYQFTPQLHSDGTLANHGGSLDNLDGDFDNHGSGFDNHTGRFSDHGNGFDNYGGTDGGHGLENHSRGFDNHTGSFSNQGGGFDHYGGDRGLENYDDHLDNHGSGCDSYTAGFSNHDNTFDNPSGNANHRGHTINHTSEGQHRSDANASASGGQASTITARQAQCPSRSNVPATTVHAAGKQGMTRPTAGQAQPTARTDAAATTVDSAGEQEATIRPNPGRRAPPTREINQILKRLAKDRQPSNPKNPSHPAPVIDPTTEATTNPSLANNEGNETSVTNLVPTTDIRRNNPDGEHGDNDDERLTEIPEDIMDEIVGMDLDELREYEALHAQSKRLPAYLKAEVDDMYYEFERQLHILAIKHQLHATLLYTHIGQTNRMRGATNYNNFCRFDPKAREVFSAKDQPLKERCKGVAKLWNELDPDIKIKYKDPDYIESIRGNVPIVVVNGEIQTARKTHVANTTLYLGSNKQSVSFVKRWFKDTVDRMNEIANCHRIQGMLIVASARSSGDLFLQGGTKMGNNFMHMLVDAGDPLRKFHPYVAGLSVIEELTNQAGEVSVPVGKTAGNNASGSAQATRKRKHTAIDEDNDSSPQDKYCTGTLKESKKIISRELLKLLNAVSNKHFRAWPGTNCARELKAANIKLTIKKNPEHFNANELCQPINAIKIIPAQRIRRAIGEGWIQLKHENNHEGTNAASKKKNQSKNPATRRVAKTKQYKKRVSAASDEDSNEESVSEDDDESEDGPGDSGDSESDGN
ncbi:hypothetical protein PGT21_034725 [Puccinia graminis f. sp. tritici]|uniref:Uncharacterized protein n=1 Tax=Puccinia graminis f. sp. tritici TaxID=56615 RepID=A0A5B0MQL4_PUCGR|nr:hypothetical protein PGT21_034725 [Puccinia graminis f. sp. tritici]